MNILVFGGSGQLGMAFKELALQNCSYTHKLNFSERSDCDLAVPGSALSLLEKIKPDAIINAAAFTDVDAAEKFQDVANLINHSSVKEMASFAAKNKTFLVHYSTDYVFDGLKSTPYHEEDKVNPLSYYGKSKLNGELAIAEAFKERGDSSGYAVMRTSWAFGSGDNFIKKILRLAKTKKTLRVIDDQYGAPTSMTWLADLSLFFISENFSSGIYNCVPSGEVSWCNLAKFIVDNARQFGAKLELSSDNIVPIKTSEYAAIAMRPLNSRLCTDKVRSLFNARELKSNEKVIQFPDWSVQVRDYVKKIVLLEEF